MFNEVDKEAQRIWGMDPGTWREELRQLPKEKVINGVLWRFRNAVGQRLLMAEKMEANGHNYAGWPSRRAAQ